MIFRNVSFEQVGDMYERLRALRDKAHKKALEYPSDSSQRKYYEGIETAYDDSMYLLTLHWSD